MVKVSPGMRKVRTILSMGQLEELGAVKTSAEAPVSGCQGSYLPSYFFPMQHVPKLRKVESEDSFPVVPDIDNFSSSDSEDEALVQSPIRIGEVEESSALDCLLLALWDQCAEQKLFRYDVSACSSMVVPGRFGFVAQLNEGRATKKRATEFTADKVCQPFDGSKFNFTKAYVKEVLFQFEPSAVEQPTIQDTIVTKQSPNLVLINVSPIEYGHVLLVPRVNDCIPQLVDFDTVKLALQFAAEADNPWFRVGYNSLGAFATINHLHFQAYYLAAPMPVELAGTMPLKGWKRKRGDVFVSRLANYPVNGFVIDGDNKDELAAVVADACIAMQKTNVPHNFLVTNGGTRVFLWPQCYAERQANGEVPSDVLDTGVNPAVWEISGHIVMKNAQDYADLKEEFVVRLLAEVSLPEEQFLDVASRCFG